MLLVARAATAAGPVSVGGYVDGIAVAPTEHGEGQQPQGLLDAWVEGGPVPWLHGRLELRGRIGGPFEGGSGIGVYNFDDTFQNVSPVFDAPEAWLELRGKQAELRAGLQRFAWGKLDGAPPTDVLNPRDFHDPIVQDFEERKLGIPALTGTYYLPDAPALALSSLRAMLSYIPWAVPPHLALVEERWFPTALIPADSIALSQAQIDALEAAFPGVPIAKRIPLSFATVNRTPPRQLDAGAIAFRLGGTWRDSDWDVYHYSGPETSPDLQALPVVFLKLPLTRFNPRATSFLTQQHDTIHMTGLDFSTAAGPFTFRAEGAWFVGRPYLRQSSDLISSDVLTLAKVERVVTRLVSQGRARVAVPDLFPSQDSIEWGFGADALWHGFQPMLQVNQIAILDSHPPLLVHDPETRLTGVLRRHFLGDRLELELRGAYLIERGGFLVYPRATYRIRDDVRLRLGYLSIGGPSASYIGQFHDNDEVVMEARYTF